MVSMKPVIKDILPDKRSITYDKLNASNYFTITAVARDGASRVSFPVLVQPLDSLPPAVPSGLKAVIDSNGVVKLSWDANHESDLQGYKVFRALKKDEEAVPLVDSVWFTTSYSDKLSLKTLNKKAYYGVASVDKRFNQSLTSALIEVKET